MAHATSIIEYELEATEATVEVGGSRVRVLGYNGRAPGPVLRLQEGQHVRVRFRNGLTQATNLHLHGLPIPPAVDAPHVVVEPGGSAEYELVVPEGSAGTYWYHPHLHGRVARQLGAGLAGALVIEGPADRAEPLAGAQEHVLLLQAPSIRSDYARGPHGVEFFSGGEGDAVLVSGVEQPTLAARTGLLRLRLANASTARYYRIALEGAEAYLIGLDGSLLDAPVPYEPLLLAPGERADVLVRAESPGEIRLIDLPYQRGPHTKVRAAAVLASIAVEGPARQVTLPERIGEVEPVTPLGDGMLVRRVVWGGTVHPLRFHVNGKPFDPARIDFTADLGTTEVWELHNPMNMDHPFHLHVHPFQVLDRNGVPEQVRAWKDVVNVPAGGTVRIVVPFRVHPGVTMFHCHIVEHEDYGMMALLDVRG
jgi:FtsP/CotA-like multicopper oxidase with cupredoxin domain